MFTYQKISSHNMLLVLSSPCHRVAIFPHYLQHFYKVGWSCLDLSFTFHSKQEFHGCVYGVQIIEDDFKADELCTRREYARWLVLANSLLERYL